MLLPHGQIVQGSRPVPTAAGAVVPEAEGLSENRSRRRPVLGLGTRCRGRGTVSLVGQVAGGRPARVREVARLSPEQLTVALIEKAAHAVNFSHPNELAGTIELWLDGALAEGAGLPDGVLKVVPRGGAG